MSRVAVAIMAKAPRPGEVKTRLSPPLGAPEGAALRPPVCGKYGKLGRAAEAGTTGPVRGR